MESDTYSQNEVSLVVGDHVLSHFASDIVGTPEGDAVTVQQDSDGNTTRTVRRVSVYTLAFSLRYASDENQILAGFLAADQEDGSGQFRCAVRDSRNRVMVSCDAASVKAPPAITFGQAESQPVPYEILMAPAKYTVT